MLRSKVERALPPKREKPLREKRKLRCRGIPDRVEKKKERAGSLE